MRGRRGRAVVALAGAALPLALAAAPSLAAEPAGTPNRGELLDRAERERAAGHDAEALAAALAAANVSVTSSLLRFIAEEHATLGQLGAAYEAAHRCTEAAANEPPSENHDVVFLGCRALMHELEPRVALVTFGWRGELPEDARLVLDGETIAPERGARGLDAGSHDVRFSAPGYEPLALSLALKAGDAREVELTLERTPSPPSDRAGLAPRGDAASRSERLPDEPRRNGARRSLTLPVLVTGGGAALLAAALATSLDASAKYADLRRVCARAACGPSPPERGSIDALDRATTIFLIAGSAAVATGAVWLTLTLTARGRANVTSVGVGPGFCSVRGAF
ncbi:MAG TPA: hypothetical protein VMI54_14220 [Polyangiaceae bacterium]|nr:hypothetical protein [Polyangiaceae bacterium]